MFQSAVVRRHHSGLNTVDAGLLAETLLFYGSVHAVLDRGLLTDFLKSIGPENLLALLDQKLLTVRYSRTMTAVITKTMNYVPTYAFGAFTFHAHADGKRIRAPDEIGECVKGVLGKSRRAREITRDLVDRFSVQDVGLGNSETSHEVVDSELANDRLVQSYAGAYLRNAVPHYTLPSGWEFRCVKTGDGSDDIYVITNLNFADINREYHKIIDPSHSSISPEFILAHILDARVDVDLASNYMSEIITRPESSDLIRIKFSHLLSRRDINVREIGLFQEILLRNGRAIRQAINSGERTFAEFVPVLQKAGRFKRWLTEMSPDAKLLDEYHRTVVADSWVNKLPIKLVRYVLVTVAGLINPGAGLVAGAGDTLLLDRMLRGWRPNQFVDGSLRKFVAGG